MGGLGPARAWARAPPDVGLRAGSGGGGRRCGEGGDGPSASPLPPVSSRKPACRDMSGAVGRMPTAAAAETQRAARRCEAMLPGTCGKGEAGEASGWDPGASGTLRRCRGHRTSSWQIASLPGPEPPHCAMDPIPGFTSVLPAPNDSPQSELIEAQAESYSSWQLHGFALYLGPGPHSKHPINAS